MFAMCSTYAAVADKPAGELLCEGTTEDTVALFWEAPTNDGGKPVTGYVVEKREHDSEIWTKYVPPLSTFTLQVDIYLSVRLSLRHAVC